MYLPTYKMAVPRASYIEKNYYFFIFLIIRVATYLFLPKIKQKPTNSARLPFCPYFMLPFFLTSNLSLIIFKMKILKILLR